MFSLKRSICMFSALVLTASLFSGCIKAPEAQLEAAEAAIKAAKDAQADKYMVNNYKNLLKALEASEEEIEKQKEAPFFARNYKVAKTMLEKTTSLAQEITKEAPQEKKRLIALVKENIPIAKENLEASAKSISNFAQSKDKAVIEELKTELSAADTILTAAIKDSEANDFLSASGRIDSVQATVKKIMETLKPKDESTQM
ncbi:MAG: hypothetical protein ACLFQB_16040 [Chitinispirillaceae bacterium]